MDDRVSMTTGEIIENQQVAPGHFVMAVHVPPSFPTPAAGQFVMIRSAGHDEPLLARPFSVYGFHRQDAHAIVDLLYRVTGRGTSLFSRMRPGEELLVHGPLGRGFTVPKGARRIILVAGGVGVAPLAFFLHERCGEERGSESVKATVYLGAGSADLITGCERLRGLCDLSICTDDGSRGHCGPVTDLLQEEIGKFPPKETAIFACGPAPMIRSLGRVLGGAPVHCQVSLEERMACGLGACLGCAVAIRRESGKIEYRRVCKDGPVFDLREIVFVSPDGV
jgi:dihydroorotate dehydrogenase electron transfer subunit